MDFYERELLFLVLLYFCLLHRANLCGKTIEVDEAGSIVMVIEIAGRKGGDALVV